MTLHPKVAILAAVAATLLIGSGCATGGGTTDPGDPDLLTRSELVEHPSYTAMQMIRQFRPIWLRDRNASFNALGIEDIANPRGIRVYFDGMDQRRGIDALEYLPVSNVRQMRKLDAADATMRFGIGHSAGAILVTTRRGRSGA